jgi:tetratricopeptide (TPR) repeat protein
MLAELGRAGTCARVALGGLTGDDTAHFVELSASVAPMPRLAAALHEVSGGNPLFVTELARLLASEDRLQELGANDALVLPSGVGEVIARRLQQLSEGCRSTLSLAAVVGREFDKTLLEAAGESNDEQLLTELGEASAARVIEEVPAVRGLMRFSHELVREALYGELGGVERAHLHAAVGDAIERLHAAHVEPELARLAHHFAEALPVVSAAKAIDYLGRAGDAAASLLAYEEAIRLYGLAAEIARPNEAASELRADMLLRAGEQILMLSASRAEPVLDEAEALMTTSPNPSFSARIAAARASLDIYDACATGKERIKEVIDLFQQLGDPAAEARGWWALRTWHTGFGQISAAGEAADRMLDCATRAGNKGLISQAAVGVASSLMLGPTPIAEALPRIHALRRETSNARSECSLLITLAHLEAMRGRFDESLAFMDEAGPIVHDAESANDIALAASCRRARIARLAGNFTGAEQIAREVCEQLERGGFIAYLRSDLVDIVDALIDQGRLDEARAELARADALYSEEDVDAITRASRARARIQAADGDFDVAERSAQTALECAFKMEMPVEQAETWLVMAEVQRAAGRDDKARVAAREAWAIAEAKGHVVFADRARELIASLEPTLAPD